MSEGKTAGVPRKLQSLEKILIGGFSDGARADHLSNSGIERRVENLFWPTLLLALALLSSVLAWLLGLPPAALGHVVIRYLAVGAKLAVVDERSACCTTLIVRTFTLRPLDGLHHITTVTVVVDLLDVFLHLIDLFLPGVLMRIRAAVPLLCTLLTSFCISMSSGWVLARVSYGLRRPLIQMERA